MTDTIKHFMWGYQPHFRIDAYLRAAEIFKELDSRFEPEVFIVGILRDDTNTYPACVEPEEDFWCRSEDLYNLRNLIDDKIKSFPESETIHSHPIAQKNADERLMRRSIQYLIKESITDHQFRPESREYFVSSPIIMNCFYISVVLGLEQDFVNAHPSLESDTWELHKYRSFDVSRGLIDSVISSYLDQCSRALQMPDPGAGSLDIVKDEVLRSAGESLLRDAAFRADPSCISGSHSIFEVCNKISCTNYEKSVGSGSIIIAASSHNGIKPIINFSSEPELMLIKGTRKLLELTKDDIHLHSNSEKVFSLCEWDNQIEVEEKVFVINFIGHHHWELTYQDQCLMRVLYGLPYLPKPSFDSEKLAEDLPRLFKKITETSIKRVISLIAAAEKESHGTMLLIASKAREEAHRLCSRGQGTEIFPKRLTPDILENMTSIDGTVIISPAGTCYAIGAILDGPASENGDPSRGARYNSAIRYTESNPNSMAVVVSEDGGVDIIPNLKPCVVRQDVDEMIQSLEEVAALDEIDTKAFYQIRSWLDERRFYLLKDDCERINQACNRVHETFSNTPKQGVVMVFMSEFEPNESLDQGFYYK